MGNNKDGKIPVVSPSEPNRGIPKFNPNPARNNNNQADNKPAPKAPDTLKTPRVSPTAPKTYEWGNNLQSHKFSRRIPSKIRPVSPSDFHIPTLRNLCTADVPEIVEFLSRERIGKVDAEKGYVYIDNGSPVLGVAHMDVNGGIQKFKFLAETGDERMPLVFSPYLDDRLGVYILFQIISQIVPIDILLTTDEEVGRSTAEEFRTDKKYAWAFSFDRRGSDTVTYQYTSPEWLGALKAAGVRIGSGSFSDISALNLGVSCANFATGYEHEHSIYCYANLAVTSASINNFLSFYMKNKELIYPHVPSAYPAYSNPVYTRSVYAGIGTLDDIPSDDTDFDEYRRRQNRYPSGAVGECEMCGETTSSVVMKRYGGLCEGCHDWAVGNTLKGDK